MPNTMVLSTSKKKNLIDPVPMEWYYAKYELPNADVITGKVVTEIQMLGAGNFRNREKVFAQVSVEYHGEGYYVQFKFEKDYSNYKIVKWAVI